MKLKHLISSLDIVCSTASDQMEITSICCDSRTAEPGSLFICFAGYVYDGNDYISMAVKKGSVAVVCERVPDIDVPYVLVHDGRVAMSSICATWFGHPSREIKVIGVTGTNGKTTITYLIKSILEQTGAKVGLMGTIKNLVGDKVVESVHTTPESYQLQGLLRQMVNEGCQYAVMEVSSSSLALHRVDYTEFSVGIFSNLTEDHLNFHKTMETYGDAKALLFERCPICVLNRDDPAWEKMKAHSKGTVFTYSILDERADVFARNIHLKERGIDAEAVFNNDGCIMEVPIPGRFSVYNALAAISCVVNLGFDFRDTVSLLRNVQGVKGRMELVPTNGQDFTVIIDFAHTPDALENLLCTVRGFAKERVILVFGCGGDRDPYKRPIMGEIAGRLADLIVVTSDNPRSEAPMSIIQDIVQGMEHTSKPYIIIENRREAIMWAMENAKKGDVILLAGKGHETTQTIGHTKIHLDEREVVASQLERMGNNKMIETISNGNGIALITN